MVKINKVELSYNVMNSIIDKIVYETRTCPEDIGLKNTYSKCDGCVDTDKAKKCVTCFKYAFLDNGKSANIRI